MHSRNKPVAGVDLQVLARQTAGLTGADLANICNEAAISAGRRGAATVCQLDFDHAMDRGNTLLSLRGKRQRQKLRYRRRW